MKSNVIEKYFAGFIPIKIGSVLDLTFLSPSISSMSLMISLVIVVSRAISPITIGILNW